MEDEIEVDSNSENLYDGAHDNGTIVEDEGERKDVLGDLPDWAAMNPDDVIRACTYHKKVADKNGVVHLVQLKDEKGRIIPVRKGNDGGEIGYNEWSKDSPEEMFLNRACYWATKMQEWQMDDKLQALDKDFGRIKAAITGNQDVLEFVESFTDEEIERATLKYEKAVAELKDWIRNVFTNRAPTFRGKKVWNKVRKEIDNFVEMGKTIREESGKAGEPLNMDAIFSLAYNIGQNGRFDDRGRWIEFNSGPMHVLLSELGQKLTATKKREISGWFRTIFWYKWQEMDTDKPKSSRLYCIKQYIYALTSLERLEALRERQGERLGIDAPQALKTPWDAVFVRERADWQRLEMENWEYREETQ